MSSVTVVIFCIHASVEITAFDELQADFKVPIDQGNPLHAVSRSKCYVLL
uniref:Uncharacterized protein n=1 Tax=Astyanax mexicanus TaxID=7994 RepID=A0A8B9GWS2_ASTMX